MSSVLKSNRVFANIASRFIVVPKHISQLVEPRSNLFKRYMTAITEIDGLEVILGWFRRVISILAEGASDAFTRFTLA